MDECPDRLRADDAEQPGDEQNRYRFLTSPVQLPRGHRRSPDNRTAPDLPRLDILARANELALRADPHALRDQIRRVRRRVRLTQSTFAARVGAASKGRHLMGRPSPAPPDPAAGA